MARSLDLCPKLSTGLFHVGPKVDILGAGSVDGECSGNFVAIGPEELRVPIGPNDSIEGSLFSVIIVA